MTPSEVSPAPLLTASLQAPLAALVRTDAHERWTIGRLLPTQTVALAAHDGTRPGAPTRAAAHDLALAEVLLRSSGATAGRGATVRQCTDLGGAGTRDERVAALLAGVRSAAVVDVAGPDGQRWGAVCGTSAATRPARPTLRRVLLEQAEVVAAEVGTLLLQADTDRAADRAAADRDRVTGLPSRRGWGLLLHREQLRSDALGGRPALVVVDLTGSPCSARVLQRAAAAASEALTGIDPQAGLARTGTHQLSAVLPDAPPARLEVSAQVLAAVLRAVGLRGVRVGVAAHGAAAGLSGSWAHAERAAARAATAGSGVHR